MIHTLVRIGRLAIAFLEGYGRLVILFVLAVAAFRRMPKYLIPIVEQYIDIGRKSLPLIAISAVFVGLLMGVQIGAQMDPRIPIWTNGSLILRTILLEMGPIILGLVLAGRVGAGIASELGVMKVTEQIDAFRTLAIDPIEFLVMPRLIAAMLAFPVLVAFFDLLAILAAFLSSHYTIGLSWPEFVKGMRFGFQRTDLYTSLIKGFLFGIVIVACGCFFGLEARRGARGVGVATTHAVIWSSAAIIVLDYVLTAVLFMIW